MTWRKRQKRIGEAMITDKLTVQTANLTHHGHANGSSCHRHEAVTDSTEYYLTELLTLKSDYHC